MKAVNPYLNFDGNAEEAFNFYKSVFGGEFLAVIRFRDFGNNPMDVPEEDRNKVAHIALPLKEDTLLMGSDVLQSMKHSHKVGNNSYINLETESAEEAERLFNALSPGGQIEMPLQKTEWAEKFGMYGDKFGVQWMVNYSGNQA
ncbi:MAG: VOC family protein [Longimicrobiaceae bacterium]